MIIADCLSRLKHTENKDDEILGMKINVNGIDTEMDIPKCMTVQEIQHTTIKDDHIPQLRQHMIKGWPENTNEVLQEIRLYWTFRDDMALKDGIILKGT